MLSCLRFQTPFPTIPFNHLINKWFIIQLAKKKESQSPQKESEREKSLLFLFFFYFSLCLCSNVCIACFLMDSPNNDHFDNCGIIWPLELLFKYFCLPFYTTKKPSIFLLFSSSSKKPNQSAHVRPIPTFFSFFIWTRFVMGNWMLKLYAEEHDFSNTKHFFWPYSLHPFF